MWKRMFVYWLCCIPVNVTKAIVFEFESTCTDSIRNTECAFFGLADTDLVTGAFRVDDQFGSPGAISNLSIDQYELIFSFGNQSFTEQDAAGTFNFLVSLDGAALSSILGNFRNANGTELRLLTVTTANVALDGHEADTFGGGGAWVLAEGSDIFTDPVPLPASLWLFMSTLGALILNSRRDRGRALPA